jgi:nitronate monooxygenase
VSPTAALRSLLGVEHPIVQAPMAGGGSTPALAAAVSNAGGLGMLAGAYSTPAQITASVAETRRLTDRPFGINLFAGGAEASDAADPLPMLAILARYHRLLDLPPPSMPTVGTDPLAPGFDPAGAAGTSSLFDAQLDAVLAAGVPVFSFTFGIPSPAALARLKERGIAILGTATTVEEARQLEAAGVDAVVAQGSEAGAHRGTFAGPFEAAMVGTLALVPQAVDAVRVPVIASGGIMDGRGIVAAEALGAAGVQMGTALLTCREAGIPEAYKRAIRAARDDQTALTRAFSGRPARGIVNEFLREVGEQEEAILPFPLQNALTRPLRNAAAARGELGLLNLWAGQAAALARDLPAADLVRQLVREAADVRARLAGSETLG